MASKQLMIKVASILANPLSDKPGQGPRKWKVRKLRGSRPAKICVYMPFYLGELDRFPTFAEAMNTIDLIERRAQALRHHG
jgi:hypothetical protein